MRTWLVVAVALVSPGCFLGGGGRGPEPDAASNRWRALVGCYAMEDRVFALDSVPDLQLNADRPGVRRARFGPQPAVVGAYWFVTDRGVLWVFRHDGLWGRSFEFQARGDSLVGRSYVRTDVPNRRAPPEPALAVRTAECPVPQAVAAP